MALVVTDDKYYKAIARAIRAKTGTDNTYKASDMAEGVESACDAVYADAKDVGYWEGYGNGYNEGKQAEYDAFWDAYQKNGTRTNYRYGFSYDGWDNDTFKPKYNLQPIYAQYMFYWFANSHDISVDLQGVLESLGVILDFSKATSLAYCFQNAVIRRIGTVDLSSATSVEGTFFNTYWLKTIEKIIVNENTVFSSNTFQNCYASSITFEGVLASNLNLSTTPTNKSTIQSVVGVLSSTVTGKTLTLNKSRVTTAFGSTDSEEWLNLVATKPNWTITLV
ncbi:MAG: hypothetical protein IJF61_04635 [Clostridia bacterium]|nr:hypothetical protein [Clostridia bacterium]